MTGPARAALLIACLAPLVACNKPTPPPTERPPEPQSAVARPGGLDAAIQAPLDKARAVDAGVEQAAARQRAAIEAQSGG